MSHSSNPDEHGHSKPGGYIHSAHSSAARSTETKKIQGQVPGAPAEGDDQLYYALYTVFARSGAPADGATGEAATAELESLVSTLEADGVTLRGFYDVSAMRDNADIMVWTHAEKPEDLQAAVRKIRRTVAFSGTTIVWSTMGVHRDAEFTRQHAPSFARGIAPEAWVCVYPFVRSWDWYYMNAERRSEMLKNHGMKGRDFPQVLPNTIATFGLNDYEWVLALEAPELVDLVDMMRHFRNTEARLHVREETPFYTGRRIEAAEVVQVIA
ncbi:hydrogen peroxide-dependent heme synthase [Rothia nasisuis]|uniref:hydrogen peroxide-dependent heme synthase n=1 Tax=Rothia nasisuis TaxID=2109647 RepID=UPI001F3C2888|nr:hydrogen peroxide-dependent heme synthase [Rothia nasisuis]